MHRAGARAAPDGSARAAHRDAAAPLASEHGGGVTERVATLLLSLHRGIIRRPAVCTCRPPVRLDLCVGECGGLSLSVRVRPPPARIFSDSLQGPAREKERERVALWRHLWSAPALALRERSRFGWKVVPYCYWVLVASPCARSSVHPSLSELRVGLLLGDRGSARLSEIGSQEWPMAFARFGALGCPHRIGQVEQNHAMNQNQY